MVKVTKKPERVVRDENDNNNEEKTYRSRKVSLDIGGMNARVGEYAGETMTLMRITPRMTNIRGIRTPAHALEGFDPATGEFLILFYDTRIKEDGSYVRNFGGGLSEMLTDPMTPEEFDAAMEIANIENGTDVAHNISDWDSVGGARRLKPKYCGKTVTIGKECVKTKAGRNMNVFNFAVPEEAYDVAEFIEAYEASVGKPPEKAAISSKKSAPGKQADAVKPKNAYEKEVTKQNVAASRQAKQKKPVEDYIRECRVLDLSDGAIIACLMRDYDMSEIDARNQIAASKLDETPVAAKQPVKQDGEGTLASRLLAEAKKCAAEGMDVPDAYMHLEGMFKEAGKLEIRTALQMVGVLAR